MSAPPKPPPPPPAPKPPPAPRPPNRPAGLIPEYIDAYMTAYRWLFTHCPPWRWLLSSLLWPGSDSYNAIRKAKGKVA